MYVLGSIILKINMRTNLLPAPKGCRVATLVAIKIPIPPQEVQNEIVRILEKFTELETELEVRKKTI